ncbi:MAG: hypothetical protein GY778_16815 [bacterium]|nr:hypothetical protein [bacterium]
MATSADAGFVVAIGNDTNGRIVASAQDPSGETWQVWAADACAAVCELAGQVGIEPADGGMQSGPPLQRSGPHR